MSQRIFIALYNLRFHTKKRLELTLEPTVENHDQNFIDNWYSDLKHKKATSLSETRFSRPINVKLQTSIT